MPNIILTNKCNRNCNYCFAQSIKSKKAGSIYKDEFSLRDLELVLNFLKKSKENKVRLMGGEPTLHSKFKEVIKHILKRNFSIHLFTNGLFNKETANFLFRQGKKISYSFNIDIPDTYSSGQLNILESNLEKLSDLIYSIGSVIWKANFKIDYLIDLVKKYKINRAIMLRPANPIIGQKNEYLHLNQLKSTTKSIVNEAIKASQYKIKIGLGCGLSKRMFTLDQIKKLKINKIVHMKWGCEGNSGRFDISTELSVFHCFPLFKWKEKKLTDFNNTKEIEDYFLEIMKKYQLRHSNNDFIRKGPCFSHILN